jgi:hypothetical protein
MTTPAVTFVDLLRKLATFADVCDTRWPGMGEDNIISEWGVHGGIRATLTVGDVRKAREIIQRMDAAKQKPAPRNKPAFGEPQ